MHLYFCFEAVVVLLDFVKPFVQIVYLLLTLKDSNLCLPAYIFEAIRCNTMQAYLLENYRLCFVPHDLFLLIDLKKPSSALTQSCT